MIIVQEYTTKNPITLIGEEAGICYSSDTTDIKKNYARGISCIESNHGRVLEFPQVYLIIDGYSARCIRELYTHIGGLPTRLQESTRYIDYTTFNYYIPDSISKNENTLYLYKECMETIKDYYQTFLDENIPEEDIANILPLGMTSKIVFRTNLRNLIDIMRVRQCSRAYSEIRNLMHEIKQELSKYSEEWELLCHNYMPIKCEEVRYCTENKSCGRFKKSEG